MGQTTQATASLRDANGNVLTGRSILWATSNAGAATVSTSGSVTAIAPGTSTISATSEGITSHATITVSLVPVAAISMTLGSGRLLVGQTTQAIATLRDANGNVLTGRSISWASVNTGAATVSTGGLVTAIAPGTTAISATSEGKVASEAITIDQVSAITLGFRRNTPGDPSFMVANGSSTVPLEIEVRGVNGNILPTPANLQRLANGVEFQGTDFRTSQAGPVTLRVSGYGVQSNQLVVTARPEEVYPVVRLPIIFHVYNNSARQWTAAWTAQMVQLLNGFYRNTATNGVPNDPNAVDTFIEFYPADKDPQGNTLAIPGVHNLNEVGNVLNPAGDAVGAQYFAQCASHLWNPTQYINVFIANQGAVSISSTQYAQGQVPAWGTLGSTNQNALWQTSGKFAISHDAATYQPRELANVLAHEIGHLLSLQHTFSQRSDRACPSLDPDGVVDTPIYDVLTYTDQSTFSVNGIPVRQYDGCAGRTMFEVNLMGYTTYHSKSFTYSQRQRMQYTLAWAYLYPTPINQGR